MAILDRAIYTELSTFAFHPSEDDAEFEYVDLEGIAWLPTAKRANSLASEPDDLALPESRHFDQAIIRRQLDDPDTSGASETASPSPDGSSESASATTFSGGLGALDADGLDVGALLHRRQVAPDGTDSAVVDPGITLPAVLPASTPDAAIAPTLSPPPETSVGATRTSRSGIVIPITAPAGNLVITKPPQALGTPFYKIFPSEDGGSGVTLITFGWNMTDVIVQPTSLTVKAACENGYTYAVGGEMGGNGTATDDRSAFTGNGIIPAAQTQVVWDVVAYQNANRETPLPEGLCTLRINDERGFNAARRGGYLAPNDAVTFALYTGESYLPLSSGWKCDVCMTNAGERLHPFALPKAILLPVMASIPNIRSLGSSHPAFLGTCASLLVVLVTIFLSLALSHRSSKVGAGEKQELPVGDEKDEVVDEAGEWAESTLDFDSCEDRDAEEVEHELLEKCSYK